MGLIEKLENIKTIKSNIKDAIIEKGGAVEDATPFSDYAGEIRNIQTGLEIKEILDARYLFYGGRFSNICNYLINNFSEIIKDFTYLFFQNGSGSKDYYLDKPINSENVTSFNHAAAVYSKIYVNNDEYVCPFSSFENAEDCQYLFYTEFENCGHKIKHFVFDTPKLRYASSMFYNRYNLEEVKMNFSNVSSCSNIFYKCKKLVSISFINTTNFKVNLNLVTTGLDRTGLMNMVQTLPQLDHTQTISISINAKKQLSDEDIAEFTAKGYTLA